MKTITMAAILCAFLTTSTNGTFAAESRYYYDANGNNVATSLPAGQNNYYYDSQGNNIGSSMKAGRNTFYYDAEGNNVGSSTSVGLGRE